MILTFSFSNLSRRNPSTLDINLARITLRCVNFVMIKSVKHDIPKGTVSVTTIKFLRNYLPNIIRFFKFIN